MDFINNGKVNIVITNHVLRYSYSKRASLGGLPKFGEVKLPKDTIKDGSIENKPVLLEIVNKLVQSKKWKRKKLYFCVPDDTVVIRDLQIPATLSKAEALGYIQTQIGNSFYLPFNDPSLAIEFLEVDNDVRPILLYAYPKDKIVAFEKVFEEAGLKPIVADLTSLSVYRYYYLYKPTEKEHVLLIHWNTDGLILTAFNEHKAVFSRYMKTVINDENLESAEVDETAAKQIISDFLIEIIRIIDFYQFSVTNGESQINKLLLSGDFAFLQLAKKELSEATTIPIHDFWEKEKQLEVPLKYIDVLGLTQKKGINP